MRVLILTGNASNQVALCHKLQDCCEIVAIVLSENIPRKRVSAFEQPNLLWNKIINRIVGYPLVMAWKQLQHTYHAQYPHYPHVPLVRVKNINDTATLQAIETYLPDLIVVSGTNLVGKKIIELAAQGKGIVNLHTGISPYIKGGPNCTNWCLAEKKYPFIGNTVMWLDAGIDTGKIIATEQTPLTGGETLYELHWKVMEHAHHLYKKVICKISHGEAVPAVPQNSIASGTTYYTKDWGGRAMLKAIMNFKYSYPGYFASVATGSTPLPFPQLISMEP